MFSFKVPGLAATLEVSDELPAVVIHDQFRKLLLFSEKRVFVFCLQKISSELAQIA